MHSDDAPSLPALRDAFTTALTIGRLEGMLTHAPVAVADLFYARSVVSALIAGLGASGVPTDRAALGAWIAADGAPPRAEQPDRIDPSTLVAIMLRELQHMPGRLGTAAMQLARAAPHLLRAFDTDALPTLSSALLRARELMQGPSPTRGDLMPLVRLSEAAGRDALFHDGERATDVLEAPGRMLSVVRDGGIGHVWALGLLMPAFLQQIELTRTPVPIFGGVGRRSVSRTRNPDLRYRWILEDLHRGAEVAIEDLHEAFRLTALLQELVETRRQSRAPEAWTLMAGFGALRRSQLAKGLGTSPAGVDHVVAPLIRAGLVGREDGAARGPFHAITRRPAGDGEVVVAGSSAIDEFDAAMADLDRLLERATGADGN